MLYLAPPLAVSCFHTSNILAVVYGCVAVLHVSMGITASQCRAVSGCKPFTCTSILSWMLVGCDMQCKAGHSLALGFRFQGVTRSNGKWLSRCEIMGQRHALGRYSTEELAAQAHDKVRIYQASIQSHHVWCCACWPQEFQTSCAYRIWGLPTSQSQLMMLSPSTCKSQLAV